MKEQIRWLEDVITNNISDLMDRVDHQEEYMGHHEDMISDNTENIARHGQEIKTNTDNIADNTRHINTHVNTCAYQSSIRNTGTITYDSIVSHTTSDNSAIDINTGHFTTDTTGYYTISYSATTFDWTWIWAYINNNKQENHAMYRSSSDLDDMGSRTWVLSLLIG